MTELKDLRAIIVDASGVELTREEEELFKSYKPAGIILFRRNCESKSQVKELVQSIRECVGRDNLPVLIDQEGGTVARLREPEFKEYPSAKHFGGMASNGPIEKAIEATRLNALSMAHDLEELGVSVNCAPCMDVTSPEAHKFLEARVYGSTSDVVGRLGEAVCEGLLSGRVTPVIKHIPGHGRATVDSHTTLPVVDASLEELQSTDFAPFKRIAQSEMGSSAWAMTGHVVYNAVDADNPATYSAQVTKDIIRGDIGFDGLLVSDCLSMKALSGAVDEKVKRALEAGLDIAMFSTTSLELEGITHGSSIEVREKALNAASYLTKDAVRRLTVAEGRRTLDRGLNVGNEQERRA